MANSSEEDEDSQQQQQPPSITPPARPPLPSHPPKIPPPPSEHPPPYTPFGGQAANDTLLPSAQHRGQQLSVHNSNRNSRVVQPQGIRKYLQYVTKRNLLIASAVVIFLLIFTLVMQWYWRLDGEANQKQKPLHGTKPLQIKELALGAYKNAGNRLSYDDSIFLSKYLPQQYLLKSGKLNPDDHLDGFLLSTQNVSKEYSECMRFTDEAYCCSTSTHSRHHKTDCFLKKEDELIHSVAVKYDLMGSWQSLADDERLLIVYNRQRHAVLDLVRKKIYQIEENRLPHGYVSVGFFFPMDTAAELDELVRSGDEFRICEYLKTSHGDYALKEEDCKTTAFKVEFELPKVQFCSNPLYTAVVQYGHVQGEEEDLTWHLRVKYDSSPDVYSAAKTVASKLEQLVIVCNDSELDVFVLGSHELYQFSSQLPNLRSEHFIQTRRF